ncbi:MAG: nucleoside kinase [Myxococcales bacterium]|nr:MAG: nucleoside kinase [Myxococcales bacterium]
MDATDHGRPAKERSMKIAIQFNGQTVEARPGTTILKLLETYPHPGKSAPLGAIVNNRLMGLYRVLRSDCTVQTIDYRSKEGANIYRRSLTMILCAAFSDLFPEVRLEIGQSLANGYYYHVTHGPALTETMLAAVEARMREIIAANRPLRPVLVTTEEAEEYFAKIGSEAKAMLLHQRRQPEVPWVVIGEFRDLVHGPLAPSTGVCQTFAILPKLPGFVLTFPDRIGRVLVALPSQPKLYAAYRDTRMWNEQLGIWSVGHLNRACIDGTISEIVKVSEGLQEKKIVAIADRIKAAGGEIRVVLVAGPSSSGKTTTTKRLAVQLMVNGIRPVALSMDNYYIDRADTPRNPDGSYNFESLEALDLDLFNSHLHDILEGKLVQMPMYDFVSGARRKDKTIPIQLQRDQVLIVEGIHGINPRLTEAAPAKAKFKLYVSALTQLCLDEHNRIFTSDARLLRRIVRDRLYRGYSAAQTIHQWPHVRAGENKHIFPYQEEADVLFDTSLVYEQAVLKPYLQRFLLEVDQRDPAYIEAYRLFNFLSWFIPIFSHEVPHTSILREFIGGSTFNY